MDADAEHYGGRHTLCEPGAFSIYHTSITFAISSSIDASLTLPCQKIISTDYVPFSMFGLCFTFICGALFLLISYCIEPAVSLIHRRFGAWHYSYLEWVTNDTLQLQRLAHEAVGAGGAWSGATSTIPLTGSHEDLAVLDLLEPDHPRLSVPLALAQVDSYQHAPSP